MSIFDPSPRREPQSRGEQTTVAVILLVFVVGMIFEIAQNYHPAKLSALLFVVFWMPLLVLHETGHALAAAIVRWRVFKMVIGMGNTVTESKVLGIPLTVKRYPIAGYVMTSPRPGHSRHSLRWKHALVYFAGPGIELLAAAIVLFVVGPGQLFSSAGDDTALIAAQTFALTATFGAVLNLIPMTMQGEDGQMSPNDGMGIIYALFASPEYYEHWMKQIEEPEENELAEQDQNQE